MSFFEKTKKSVFALAIVIASAATLNATTCLQAALAGAAACNEAYNNDVANGNDWARAAINLSRCRNSVQSEATKCLNRISD